MHKVGLSQPEGQHSIGISNVSPHKKVGKVTVRCGKAFIAILT
ncbi:hypothetical protein [Pseudoalteromonas piscicida]